MALTARRRTDFVQVCVNDDGVGVAARQSQDLDIYQGPLEAEETAVRDALKTNSSVKLRAQDCRVRGISGFGYTYIESCLRSLRALAVLRTGRLLAFLDGTDDSRKGFDLAARVFGCVACIAQPKRSAGSDRATCPSLPLLAVHRRRR